MIRKYAAETLGQNCGAKDAEAIEALDKLLADSNRAVRRAVALALAHINPTASVDALLIAYRADDGKARAIRTEDLNRYLREIAGVAVTAKDFRTLHASALAGEALAKLEPAESVTARKRQMAAVTKQVAAFLQNTPAISRNSYVAPCLYALFENGRLAALWAAGGDGANGVRQREVRLAAVLEAAG